MQKMRSLLASALALTLTSPVWAGQYQIIVDAISPYTNEVKPELNQSRGMLIEVVEAAMQEAGLKLGAPSQQVPWRRAQQMAEHTSGALIFPFARTPLRENNWQWIAVLINDDFYAYTTAGKKLPASLKDLHQAQNVGVLAGGAPNSIALEKGLKFDAASSEEVNFLKLLRGHVDVILSQGYMAAAGMSCARQKVIAKPDLFNALAQVQRSPSLQSLPLWLATSLKTPAADVEQLRQAIENFKKTPRYQKMIQLYSHPLPLARVQCLSHQQLNPLHFGK